MNGPLNLIKDGDIFSEITLHSTSKVKNGFRVHLERQIICDPDHPSFKQFNEPDYIRYFISLSLFKKLIKNDYFIVDRTKIYTLTYERSKEVIPLDYAISLYPKLKNNLTARSRQFIVINEYTKINKYSKKLVFATYQSNISSNTDVNLYAKCEDKSEKLNLISTYTIKNNPSSIISDMSEEDLTNNMSKLNLISEITPSVKNDLVNSQFDPIKHECCNCDTKFTGRDAYILKDGETVELACKKCATHTDRCAKILAYNMYMKKYGIQFNICKVCKINPISQFNFHTGHNIPRSEVPETSIKDLNLICETCNLKMSNKFTIDSYTEVMKIVSVEFAETNQQHYENAIKSLGNFRTTNDISNLKDFIDSAQHFIDLYNSKN
jgi:hypothetical protein